MVIIKNKRMIFSEEDRYVGTRYDANTKTLTFGLYYNYNTERWIGDLTFNLIIRYSDTNETDILAVVKGNTSIGTDGTAVKELKVTFTETALSHSGTHLIQLTGFDMYETYRWSTYQSFIYIEDALNAKPISVTTLSLLEAYEAQLTNKLLLLQATEDQVVLEEANRKVAETARADAETARVAAEKSRVDAEAARVEAESSRVDAETARATAETARETAESKRVEAEDSRVKTESARVEAESARADAETARTNAEAARAAAENSRAEAESSRVAAEDARAKAEVARESTEKGRVKAEEAREDAENSRVEAENARVTAETARETAESKRVEAEAARVKETTELMKGYTASSLKAESYAVGGTGTREGEDTDNAKYYASLASMSEVNAAASEADALEYAKNASSSQTAAAGSATAAAASETNAAASATNAAKTASDISDSMSKISSFDERITQLENASALCIGIKRKCAADGTPQSDTKWTRWGQHTDAVVEYARGNEAVQNDLMEVYPYNALRPCNLPLAGDAAPVAYLGDADFDWYAETGDAAGTSVMLEIPTEWYAAHWFDTDASGQMWEYKCIADSPRYPNSVYVKEEMKRSDGTLTDYFYFPIFMGYKDSDGHYVSKAGVQGTYNLSVTNARTAVKTNGDNWQILDVWAWEIVTFLCDIMSANEDCKATYGTGVSSYYKTAKCTVAQTSVNSIIVSTSSAASFAVGDIVSVGTGDWAQNVAATREITAIAAASTSGNTEITLSGATFTTAVENLMWREVHKNGKTIDMASPNGTAGANDGVHAVRTLYIENLYSAFHTGVDGINLKFNSDKMGLEMWACKDPSKYSDAYGDGYECLNVVMPLSATASNNDLSGYIKKMLFDEDKPLLEMPDTVGGGSNSYEAAYVWKNKNGQRPFFGGASDHGSSVSLRCRHCRYSFGSARQNCASRPLKR